MVSFVLLVCNMAFVVRGPVAYYDDIAYTLEQKYL
jgi:hypothetical protein